MMGNIDVPDRGGSGLTNFVTKNPVPEKLG
jgi:hypothetical protein